MRTGTPRLVRADDGGGDVLEAAEAGVAAEHDLLAGRLDVAAAADAVVALEIACLHLSIETPCAARRAGSSVTRYCLSAPPKPTTSMTPGTCRSFGPICHSTMVRSSSGERDRRWRAARTCRSRRAPVVIGPSSGLPTSARDLLADLHEALVDELRARSRRRRRRVKMSVTIEMPSLLTLRVCVRPGDARHAALDRLRDLRLHLGRGERRRARDDLHLDVRDVGYGVDRQLRRRVDARRR